MKLKGFSDNEWKRIQLQGKDSLSFLNNTCTQKLTELKDGEKSTLAHTDRHGGLIAYGFVLFHSSEKIEIFFQDVAEPGLHEALDKYKIMEQTSWETPEVLQGTFVWREDFEPEFELEEPSFSYRADTPIRILFHNANANHTFYEDVLDDEWERVRLEFGIPRLEHELVSKRIPFEIGLTHMVSVDKGCYIGQETLTKFAHRAKFPRQLCYLKALPHEALKALSELESSDFEVHHGDNALGTLTSVNISPAGEPRVLLIGPRSKLKDVTSSELTLKWKGTPLSVEAFRLIP